MLAIYQYWRSITYILYAFAIALITFCSNFTHVIVVKRRVHVTSCRHIASSTINGTRMLLASLQYQIVGPDTTHQQTLQVSFYRHIYENVVFYNVVLVELSELVFIYLIHIYLTHTYTCSYKPDT